MDLARVDHLVVAAPDLLEGVRVIEDVLGVTLLEGGRHPAWGTRNYLLPLGPSAYLEVIGPDTDSGDGAATLFGMDRLGGPSLVSWAVKARGLPVLAARARRLGLPVGRPAPGRRVRPDGRELRWTLTDPTDVDMASLVPFFIEWEGEVHPAQGWTGEVALSALCAIHPDPAQPEFALAALDLDLEVEPGERPALVATLRAPTGDVEIGTSPLIRSGPGSSLRDDPRALQKD